MVWEMRWVPVMDTALFSRLCSAGIFASGWAGVSFFFVLSGFLITYLILAEVEWSEKLNVPAFYMRRILRIWPLYYAVLLFGFWLYPAVKSALGISSYIETGNPLSYLLFLSNFDVLSLGEGRGAMSINITWSVAIEEQFYIVWPLLFFFLPTRFYKFIFPTIILVSLWFRWQPRQSAFGTLFSFVERNFRYGSRWSDSLSGAEFRPLQKLF